VKPKLGFNRFAVLTGLEGKGGIGKSLDHFLPRKPPEVALAFRAAGLVGVLDRKRSEVLAGAKPGKHFLSTRKGFRLGAHDRGRSVGGTSIANQDVPSGHFAGTRLSER
jgi:hypothetical protein